MKRSKRICSFPGCGRRHYAKDLCWGHYEQHFVRGKELHAFWTKDNPKPKLICKHPYCKNISESKGYCHKHYFRFSKYGDPSIIHTRGRKSIYGHQKYPHHALMKRNRIIKLKKNPICECCGLLKSTMVHHIDGKKTNHAISNLMALCGRSCHVKFHRTKKKPEFKLIAGGFLAPIEFSNREVKRMFIKDQLAGIEFRKQKDI